jgi:signal transduction histidine kinase
VDDSALDAEMARRALEGDCDVRVYTDASSAVEDASRHGPPDVVLLDWLMPNLSGLEACRFLRVRHPELTILVITALTETEQLVEALGAGANDFVRKPYAIEELRARVRTQIRHRELLERAQHAEQTLRDLLESLPDAVFAVGSDGRIKFANHRGARALEMDLRSLCGRGILDLIPELAEADLAGNDRVTPITLRDISLKDEIYEPIVRHVPDGDVRTVICLRLVSDRRRAESRRLDLYSQVVHDLRSPLSAMLTRSELILAGRRGVVSAELVDDVRKMQRNITELVSMVNNFLELARYEARGYELHLERTNLQALLHRAADDFGPIAQVNGQRLTLEVPEGPVVAVLDSNRILRVINNLISNALKFTPQGGEVRLGLRRSDELVELSVSDTGPGVPDDQIRLLFERYARAGNASGTPGSGLGLMIVREIVEAHGGSVGAKSSLGQGSTFWVRLPDRSSHGSVWEAKSL